jgi:non-ribosomal peptide synthetase component F
MIGHLKRLLEGIISHPASRIADLPLLAPDETTRLLSEWNDQEAKRTDERDFPGRFEEQVRRTPDAIAVTHQGEALTYEELNRRANRLARALISAGVGRDTIVAVLDERGPDFLTMILGVFKAGAAYLPLDPHHPALRVARVLELSRPPVAVTSARLREQLATVLELTPEPARTFEFSMTYCRNGDATTT